MKQSGVKRIKKLESPNSPFKQFGSPLSSGERGNFQTIEEIKRIAHEKKSSPIIRNFTQNILNSKKTRSQNYYDECKAIGEYVQKTFDYVRDPRGDEFIIDPELAVDMIQRGNARGDCEDMSLLIATCLLNIGAQPYFTIVRYPRAKAGWQHIYVTVKENNLFKPKKKLVLDAIIKHEPIGYEVPFAERKYIKV